ncbi:MAG: endonuclease/exonuclease/phosphatase family protein [Kangiellaceae bacterium]|jgi:hypothetical protein|nr:endonuclease/exonuclease/phosphatase family protein [Kangiellaceae bacterium]
MTQPGENPREAWLPMTLLSTKAPSKLGTWNVRTMFEIGKTAQIAKEMRRYNIEVLGICESRWNGSGTTTLASGERIIYSGHSEEDHGHSEGVAIMMSENAAKALVEWEPVSSRIMVARFNGKGRKTTII